MNYRTLNDAGRFALTGVAFAACCLVATPSWSLGLGRLAVQSALGEGLRAEIDVTSLAPEEAATLQLRVAGPDVYQAAGVDYNAVLGSTRVELQRRPDGRSVLRLSSDRAVVEPFLDVILEASWASGRLVRAYTLLLDPPLLPQQAPPVMAATTPAVVSTPPAPVTPAQAAPHAATAPVRPAPEAAPAARTEPARVATPAPAVEAAPRQVRVNRGDTLSRIAERTRTGSVSLDQMLVALFRANPNAFMGENMNRLKAGVVLDVPRSDEAQQVAPGEAREVIVAQSADFDAYRRRLASGVGRGEAPPAAARQDRGTVQARVEDRSRQDAEAPDRLTLAQPEPEPGSKAEQADSQASQASREAEARAAAARVAELARNVEELRRLQAAAETSAAGAAAGAAPDAGAAPGTTATDAAAPAGAAPTVVAQAPVPAAPPVAAPASETAAAAPTAAPTPATPEPPAAKPAAPAPAAPAAATSESGGGFLATLMDNPLVPALGGVLVLLLAGLGVYRLRGRMKRGETSGETSFLESRAQPDSFFGASGGQHIDTREAQPSSANSSMSYSLSQLDAIGDVDPVAEADVYLAYGRDLQAEEILKEALRATPDRQAIRVKLLEVYAKRRDTKGFELLATQLFSMTGGQGEDWLKAQELGRGIDADNSLYQPGGQPTAAMMEGGQMVEPLGASTLPATQKSESSMSPETSAMPSLMDLDLDLGEEPTRPATASGGQGGIEGMLVDTSPSPLDMTQPLGLQASRPGGGADLDLDLGAASPVSTQAASGSDFGSLDFDLDATVPATRTNDLEETQAPSLPDLDFGPSVPDATPSELGGLSDTESLSRKLDLAEEFRQIGDVEGARDLLEEVVSKADGVLKTKAQSMLDRLA